MDIGKRIEMIFKSKFIDVDEKTRAVLSGAIAFHLMEENKAGREDAAKIAEGYTSATADPNHYGNEIAKAIRDE